MRFIGTAAAGLCVGLLAAMALLWSEGRFTPPAPGDISFGTPRLGAPFALKTADGATVTEAALQGQLTLLTFTFERCGAPCDISLQLIAQVLAVAPAKAGVPPDGLRAIAVGIDPARQSGRALEAYVRPFASADRLVAVTGREPDVRALARAYGLPLTRDDADAGDPLRGFLPPIYLVGRNGQYVTHFAFGTPLETITAAIAEAQRGS
ncbi:MAG: SCO family protein [Pseudomonadota bacterium]